MDLTLRNILAGEPNVEQMSLDPDRPMLTSRFNDESLFREIATRTDPPPADLNTHRIINQISSYVSQNCEQLAIDGRFVTADIDVSAFLAAYIYRLMQDIWAAIQKYQHQRIDLDQNDWMNALQRTIGALKTRWWLTAISEHMDWINQLPAEIAWFIIAGDVESRVAQIQALAAESYQGSDPGNITQFCSIRLRDRGRHTERRLLRLLDLDRAFDVFDSVRNPCFDWRDQDRPRYAGPAHQFSERIARLFPERTYSGVAPAKLRPQSARNQADQTAEDFPPLASQYTLMD